MSFLGLFNSTDDDQLDVDNPIVVTDPEIDSIVTNLAPQTPDEPDFTQDDEVIDDQDNTPGDDAGEDDHLVFKGPVPTPDTKRATVDHVLAWFKSQIGYREGSNNHNKYAAIAHQADHEPWCDTFINAGMRRSGQDLPTWSAYCPTSEAAFKAMGRLGVTPRKGAEFFVYFPSLGRVAHTGIVESVNSDGTVTTIEGNTNNNGSANGNGVYRRRRPAHRASGRTGIHSYGYPEYKVVVPKPPTGKGVGVVKVMQKAVHVPANGIWDDQTEKALMVVLGFAKASTKYHQARVGVKADGDWGPKSKAASKSAIKKLQKAMGKLTADGQAGHKTRLRFRQYRTAYYKTH